MGRQGRERTTHWVGSSAPFRNLAGVQESLLGSVTFLSASIFFLAFWISSSAAAVMLRAPAVEGGGDQSIRAAVYVNPLSKDATETF